jgi:hypothetical protein
MLAETVPQTAAEAKIIDRDEDFVAPSEEPRHFREIPLIAHLTIPNSLGASPVSLGRRKSPWFEDFAAISELEERVIPWQSPGDEPTRRLRKTYAAGAFASAESVLRGSARPSAPRPGGGGSVSEGKRQAQRLLLWAQKNGRLIDPSLEDRLVNISGVEHDVFHDDLTNRWVKMTKPGKAGKEYHAREEQPGVPPTLIVADALPSGYLRRLRLANAELGDDIYLHGVIDSPGGPRLVTSQRHVRGEAATVREIARHFTTAGFRQINEKTFYHVKENLLVSDAHGANVFRTPEGVTVPFDVAVQQPRDALLRAVRPAPTLSFEDDDAPPLDF